MRGSQWAAKRKAMVDRQIAARGVRDERVLAAMREVPREKFVPEAKRDLAYEDMALGIEADQTISQPYIVALMTELAEIGAEDSVLEIGAGSGYAAAVLSRLARHVTTIERHGVLARTARERLAALGYANVDVVHGDGSKGWPVAAPFDAILVAAAADRVPLELKAQLKVGGRLIIPIHRGAHEVLLRIRRTSHDTYEEEDHGDVAFVPLVGSREP